MDLNDGRLQSSPVANGFSSPPRAQPARHAKQKRAPSITPRKFNAFFARRSTRLAPNGASVDQSSRALGAITGSAVNRRQRHLKDSPIPMKPLGTPNAIHVQDENGHDDDHNQAESETPRQSKRRKTGHHTPPDSSPIKPPPLFNSSPSVRDDVPTGVRSALLSPLQSLATSSQMTEDISDFECDHDDSDDDREPPRRLKQLTHRGMGAQLFQRQLGGMPRAGRSYLSTPSSAWHSETANFSSGPTDAHFCSSHEGLARCIPFCTASCNTNSLVAVGDEEGRVRLLDSSPKARFDSIHLCFQVHGNAIIDMAFSEDDQRLATASGDQSGKVVDMMTQTPISVLGQHTASLKQVRFQPGQSQGNVLATSGRDGSIQIWDLRCNGGAAVMDPIVSDREAGLQFTALRKISTGCVVNSFFGAHEAMPRHQTRSVGLLAPTTTSTDHQTDIASRGEVPGRISEVSVTALQWLPTGREHLLLSACEADTSIKLWDIRCIHTSRNHRAPMPLSYTATPASHTSWRHFGISSLTMSTNGSRLYALCKDNTVYAYSTSHMFLGPAPGSAPVKRPKHAPADELPGPLYGFRHPNLHATSFYVKSALRPLRGGRSEMLAVGSADNCPVLFPTDERYFEQELQAARLGLKNSNPDSTMTSSSFSRPSAARRPALSRTSSFAARTGAAGGIGINKDDVPIIRHVGGQPLGTPLVRGHEREVGSLSWTAEGNLVTVGDDFMVRCWYDGNNHVGAQEDEGEAVEAAQRPSARELRTKGEGEGRRWGCGWSDVNGHWDSDEEVGVGEW
ncbi:WD domain-containing protein [Diaporthe helianthi]|uniref:WD domain-containing protein n=1 Tax=Diaporthe helianthi TaxID=158607 RepID=A0A2P5ICF9_DIAHE|nr:WD domain-containing protein [Diaporthe helianthi]